MVVLRFLDSGVKDLVTVVTGDEWLGNTSSKVTFSSDVAVMFGNIVPMLELPCCGAK